MVHTNKSIILVLLKNNGKMIDVSEEYDTLENDYYLIINNYIVNIYKNRIWSITRDDTRNHISKSNELLTTSINASLDKIINRELFLE